MRSILAEAAALAWDVEALLLPKACVGCGGALPAAAVEAACCDVCLARLRPLGAPACGRCGQLIDTWERGAAGPGGRKDSCGFCRAWPEELAWAGSAVWLDAGPARELVHALKYGGWRVAAAPMARTMARSLGARLAESDVLVPVPLGARRLKRRGYNQAAVLAEALARAAGVATDGSALARTRETRSQTALSPEGRWRNVAGAFAAARRVRGVRVVVVDDVLTTGATLAACAAALRAAGADEVGAVTFARAAVPG